MRRVGRESRRRRRKKRRGRRTLLLRMGVGMEKRLLPSRRARMARRVGEKLDLASDFITRRFPLLFSLPEGCITGYGVVGRGVCL